MGDGWFEGVRCDADIGEVGVAGEVLVNGDGGWKRPRGGGSSRLADGLIEETVEAERETLFMAPGA
jgi:hypothetical protein